MDWPISGDALNRPVTVESNRQSSAFFVKTADAPEPPGTVTWKENAASERRSHKRSGLRRAAALSAATISLLIGGSVARFEPGFVGARAGSPPSTSEAAAQVISLPPPDLLRPLSPEEATKENADRPFVNRPDAAASRFILHADETNKDRALNCLAQAVYYEAASEGVDGGRAVAQVVLNRVRHPGYPASVCGVVYQGSDRPTGCQFTFTCDGSLLRPPVQSLWTRSLKIAQEALAGRVFAPIGHATSYHADYVLPYWADALDKTVQIGRHIFYRLRGTFGDSRSFFQHYSGGEPEIGTPVETVILPQSSDTALLASALISDSVNAAPSEVEKAPQPASSLLVDSAPPTLVADAQATAAVSHTARSPDECPASGGRKKLAPLRATDMRSKAAAPSC